MPENLYPVSQLPHEEWLSENKEFTQQNNIPTAIKRKIGGVRLVFNRYKTTESEEKANTYLDSCKRQSFEIADDLQTWKENVLNLPDDETNDIGQNTQQDGSGVEFVNGKMVTPEEQRAEKEKQMAAKTENENKDGNGNEKKGGVLGVVLTLLGLAGGTYAAIKFLSKK